MSSLIKLYVSPLAMLILLLSNTSSADMLLNKGILNFYAGGIIRDDIEVTNNGKEPLYLSISTFKINHPESSKPERIAMTDPRSAALLASPNKMIVSAGQKKILRIIVREAPSKVDQVYRIKIMPYSPPIKPGETTKKQVGVKVLLGYELLAFLRPHNHYAKLNVKQQGKTLTITNEGNTNTILRSIKQCQDKEHCQEIKGKRLYAGQSIELKLPQAQGKIIIYKSVGSEFSLNEY